MKKKILINASNLHSGGAVAVASSFINELSSLLEPHDDISILASEEVDNNLKLKRTDLNSFSSYKVMDVHGIKSIWSKITKEFDKYDVVFTVFGPAYFLFSSSKHIFGFAQPWIIYPNNPISKEYNFFKRLNVKFKYFVQSLFFSRAALLIVELNHVKRGIQKFWYLKNIPIHIVNSTVDTIFHEPQKWEPVKFPKTNADIKLGVIARNYPHKNLKCYLDLKQKLFSQYNLNVDFYVTFSDEEWLACTDVYRQEIVNIGLLKLDQCPSFYEQIDGVVFPSFLECFSATPLESMMMKKPLFSSDLSFIRDCSKGFAYYFDPLDINNMAKVIAEYYINKDDDNLALEEAKSYSNSFSNAKIRAEKYLAIIKKSLVNSENQ